MKKDHREVEFDERILQTSCNELVCPVYTTPLNEFRLKDYCKDNGIVCYLPLRKAWKVNEYNRGGKAYRQTQVVLRPMFPSYVFVKMAEPQQMASLRGSHSIVRFLFPCSQESFLNDIRTVRALELAGLGQELEFNAGIAEGDRFLIESGIWAGVTGWLRKKRNRFLWTVELDFINEFVSTSLNPSEFKMSRLGEEE